MDERFVMLVAMYYAGLIESMLAAALARCGKSVLHLDRYKLEIIALDTFIMFLF